MATILANRSIWQKCGSCLYYDGRYGKAETLYPKVVQHREKVLGPEHPDTLGSINDLGLALSKQGKYKNAENTHQRALRARKKVLGLEHPDTIDSINNFGLALFKQGKYRNAENVFRRALRGREKVLGPEHPGTVTNVNNLGILYSKLGKYEEAETMHRRALNGNEKVLLPTHPMTLICAAILARSSPSWASLKAQKPCVNESGEARRCLIKFLRRCLQAADYPGTVISVNDLGLVLSKLGKYEKVQLILSRLNASR